MKTMPGWSFVLAFLSATLTSLAAENSAASASKTPKPSDADAMGEATLVGTGCESDVLKRLAGEGFTGAVVTMTNGEFKFAAGSGEAAAGIPFTPNTVADPESITKLTTVMATLRLVEVEKLSLEDTLGKWFPAAGADKAKINLRQLLSHTSGIADSVEGIDDFTPISREEVTSKLLNAPLEFPPGSKQAYSNGGYILLSVIIERASGHSLFDFLEAEVFRRANVRASYDPAAFPPAQVAWSKINGPWTNIRDLCAASKGPFWGVWGAGGLFLSVKDLARLMDAFMAGKIVKHDVVALALQPVSKIREGADRGLGFIIYETRRKTRYLYHNGWGEYFNADLRFYPEKKFTVAVISTSRVPNALRTGREIAGCTMGPDLDDPVPPALSGETLGHTAPEAQFITALLNAAAATDEVVRLQFIRQHISQQLLKAKGEKELVRMLARINSPLRRPLIVEMRKQPSGVLILLKAINMERVRFFLLLVTASTEEGRIKLAGLDLQSCDAPKGDPPLLSVP
jgi:CubicO group peptidase (beta-lactamase class C family)